MSEKKTKNDHRLRVFISYSKFDIRIAKSLYRLLVHVGCDPWIDEENLLPGQDWKLEISHNIKSAHIVLVCLSANSINKAGYLQKEIREALDIAEQQTEGTIFIIPIKLDECKLPQRLESWQWVEIFKDAFFKKLMDAIRVRAHSLGFNVNLRNMTSLISLNINSSFIENDCSEKQRFLPANIEGHYTSKGKNSDGSSYKCHATISKMGTLYTVTWYLGASIRTSTGCLKENILTVYGDYLVIYKIEEGGVLQGIWGDSATEILIPQ